MWLDLIVAKRKSKRVTTLQKVYSIFIACFVCLFVCLFVYLICFLFTDNIMLSLYYLLLLLRGDDLRKMDIKLIFIFIS